MDLLPHLVKGALASSNVTAAALFRAIESWKPTLLLDEWDSQNPELKEAIRNILNSGFSCTGITLRCDGEDNEVRPFSTFCPKAVAGIGELPDTAASRAITITLHRKLRTENVERLRHFDGIEFRRKCARFVQDNLRALQNARPALPDELDDRQQDIWEPLLAIADLCGPWGPLARIASLKLSEKEQGESLSVALLKDIRTVFQDMDGDRIRTEELLEWLNGLAERPWRTICDGQPLHAHRLAKMLGRFEIAPRSIAIGRTRPKGYTYDQFEDAFARYLPEPGPKDAAP